MFNDAIELLIISNLAPPEWYTRVVHMVLAMARPWKHPKTGMYWVRKRVPDRLRPLLGKIEFKKSLGTKNPAEAKLLHAIAIAEIEQAWLNLAAGERTLTEREADELAEHFYATFVAAYRENPSEQREWDTTVGAQLITPASIDWSKGTGFLEVDPNLVKRSTMQTWCHQAAIQRLSELGLLVDEVGQTRLTRAAAKAFQAAALELERQAASPFVHAVTATPLPAPRAPTSLAKGILFEELIQGWAQETNPTEKTVYSWKLAIDEFLAHLGHADASRVTADDVLGWKAKLLDRGLSGRTIKYGKLAALRAVLEWGVRNRKLSENVAAKISVSGKSSAEGRKRGFTEDEAATVLAAANLAKPAYLHWVPWLCAFTGARVAEICQLRKEDIVEIAGIVCLKLVPEAGSLKNENSERAVPLHPALIERGFLAFVAKAKPGPIFIELTPDRFGSRGGNGQKLIGRWVRGLGLTDPRLSPSHSWRHRFKTVGRRVGMAQDISNALSGHGAKDVADLYGEFEIAALARELNKLPDPTKTAKLDQ